MRFISWTPEYVGQIRTQSWFAICPVKINGETRWLEKVTVKWMVMKSNRFLPPCLPYLKWVKYEFV